MCDVHSVITTHLVNMAKIMFEDTDVCIHGKHEF